MEKNAKFLAIDLGAESGRAITGCLEKNILKIDEVHRFTTHRVQIGQHLFWDLPEIVNELKVDMKRV